MRWLLVLLLPLLLFPDAATSRRGKRVIVVYDYTGPSWAGIVEETVDDFNAHIPKRGPRLKYARMDGECPQSTRRSNLAVCSPHHAVSPDGRIQSGLFYYGQRRIDLTDDTMIVREDQRERIVCHEMMHALAQQLDNNTYDPVTHQTTWAYPTESCVWGALDDLGPLDVAWLQERYGKRRR